MPGQSPIITQLSWGSVETDAGTFRDAKLWPGGARGWDWNETGTDHVPGVQPTDVDELLGNGAEVVVVGRGQQGRLEVMDETLSRIEEQGASAEILKTQQAIERYNELAQQGVAVGALIHSTC